MVSKQILLSVLPPFNNDSVLIEKRQDVHDIVKEVCRAHEYFANDYDYIARYFFNTDTRQMCRNLFNFCKENIRYKVEGEENQTTKSPAAIIALGDSVGGDCKHYAGFIGGVLDAIKRGGKRIEWFYRFASYRTFDKTPQHVFVVVNDNGKEIWIDPVLKTFDEKLYPTHKPIDKKINSMPLYRISGTDTYPPVDEAYQEEENDPTLTPEVVEAINSLLTFGVLNEAGQFSEARLAQLSVVLPPDDYQRVFDTYQYLIQQSAAVNGFFSKLWSGVKTVTLAAPRTAFLSLVSLNVFGYATKLKRAISTTEGKDKVRSKWVKLGGKMSAMERAINNGAGKKAILAGEIENVIGAVPAIPAWVATASAVVAAIMPIVTAILNKQKEDGQIFVEDQTQPTGGGGIMDFIKNNPLIVLVGVAGAVYLFTRKKTA